MENASKALIIAGAILIAILLISVAILIINSTGSVTDQVAGQSEGMTISTFNAQFDSYAGTRSTSQVTALIKAIETNNVTNANKVGYVLVVKDGAITQTKGTKASVATFTTSGQDADKTPDAASKFEVTISDLGVCTATTSASLVEVNPAYSKGAPDGYTDIIFIKKL